MQQRKHKKTPGPTGLHELFLLTVPIEEVACWQYKTVSIMFSQPQTITITLDVVKWRWAGYMMIRLLCGLWTT